MKKMIIAVTAFAVTTAIAAPPGKPGQRPEIQNQRPAPGPVFKPAPKPAPRPVVKPAPKPAPRPVVKPLPPPPPPKRHVKPLPPPPPPKRSFWDWLF